MYERVLIPTDGSDGTAAAVENGIEIAAAFGATVHALFVVDETYPAMAHYDAVVEEAEAIGTAALDAIEAAATERGVECVLHLRRGVPWEAIIAYADEYDVDIIAMGTHGRTGFDRFVHTGSTTERVVRHSPVPVLSARIPGTD